MRTAEKKSGPEKGRPGSKAGWLREGRQPFQQEITTGARVLRTASRDLLLRAKDLIAAQFRPRIEQSLQAGRATSRRGSEARKGTATQTVSLRGQVRPHTFRVSEVP